jgi:quercetin dioxygenase-like cupin family protein
VVLLEDVAHQNLPGVPATGAVSSLLTPVQMQMAIARSRSSPMSFRSGSASQNPTGLPNPERWWFLVTDGGSRRIVVGLDAQGRSTVVSDATDMALNHPPTGVAIQEVWWQAEIPARLDDDGARTGPIGLTPPRRGGVVRILTVPPSPGGADWVPDLHFDDSMHVITLIAGRLDIVLEVGEVTLRPGDSIVLPASVHDLRNTTDEPATFVYTSFPLVR